jgi:hypothetical protein
MPAGTATAKRRRKKLAGVESSCPRELSS